jgi:hypothetical protein
MQETAPKHHSHAAFGAAVTSLRRRAFVEPVVVRTRSSLRVLVTDPDLSYQQIGRLLAMPVGSIEPTGA